MNQKAAETTILPPDYTLKKTIGENVDLRQVFSEENISKAQGAIDQHKDSFIQWALEDIAVLEGHFANKTIKEMEEVSDKLKSQAGTFGYSLATLVAKSLNKFCIAHPNPSPEHLVVIRKHLDTLKVIFGKKITGDGGVVGNQLLEGLTQLVEKFK